MPGPDQEIPTSYPAIVQLTDTFLVVGGRNVDSGEYTDAAYEYNAASESWDKLGVKVNQKKAFFKKA